MQNADFVKKPPLNDLVLRNIAAAIILYPELLEKYEEKLLSFEISASPMSKIIKEIAQIMQENGYKDSDNIIDRLKLNFKTEIEGLWEINMLKKQKYTIPEIKKIIDNDLIGIQLKQLDEQISECSTLMKQQPENSAQLYKKYQTLITERNNILAQSLHND